MNSENIKIDNFIRSNYASLPNYIDTFANISKNSSGVPIVTDTTVAFNFDIISNKIYYPKSHKSSDALLLRDQLYLIEFKSGLSPRSRRFDEIKNSIVAKISTSLHTIEKIIYTQSNVNTNQLKRNFVLVVDASSAGFPLTALMHSMSGLANLNASERSILNRFSNYIRPYFGSIRLFYDDIIILNNINFTSRIASLP